ncbi:hypothetical protein SAMN05428949_6461 [Chitinophaga sp. YR627]|uniref:hypothetical protein n=1 Tax=Chitinophaga sp. YR627 TaxID=1881041 RepID=UPI0008E4AB77|nr:hypothetical protein [Chitinophaga sp. YR627]SFO74897.1 hypothetical protein SAMN05428949_6461 [Chitinophaga sp. YR627]
MRKILTLIVLIIFSCKLYAQSPVFINACFSSKDSITLEIKNNSDNETFFFSIYKQHLFGKNWLTNNYDVFCDIENPNTTVLRIKPQEQLLISVRIDDSMIQLDKMPKKYYRKSAQSIFYRYMFWATKEMNTGEHKYYSNILN